MFGFIATAFEKGGANMFVILATGIFMFGVIIERTVVLYFQSNPNKEDFVRILTKYILVGDLRQALKVCSSSKFPLAKILQAGLMKAKESDEAVQAAMDEAALRELPRIEKRVGFLAVIGNAAVLMGLLGTIFGLIRSFGAVARRTRRRRRPSWRPVFPRPCTTRRSVWPSPSPRRWRTRSSRRSRSSWSTTSTRRPCPS